MHYLDVDRLMGAMITHPIFFVAASIWKCKRELWMVQHLPWTETCWFISPVTWQWQPISKLAKN